MVFELCSLTGAEHDYDGSDTEWIQLSRAGEGIVAMVSLEVPLVIFFDRQTHQWLRQLAGWAQPLRGLFSVVATSYWQPSMSTEPRLLTALYRGQSWRAGVDAGLFSGEDLWLAGT